MDKLKALYNFLKNKENRSETIAFLINNLGFTKSTACSYINTLLTFGIIVKDDNNYYKFNLNELIKLLKGE